MVVDHPTFGQVKYPPGATEAGLFDPTQIGAEGSLSADPFHSPVTDFYLTNPIARASRTMAECSRLRNASLRVAAE